MKITLDTTILFLLGKNEIRWDDILNAFIDDNPVEVYVTSAGLQEFHKKKPYPERLKILKDLKSIRSYGSGLYGQGLYGGKTVKQAKIANSLFTVGYSEIGREDCISSEDDIKNLNEILFKLTNGSSNGWDWESLKGNQINQYRDAQAFEAHLRYKNDIFLTNDRDFDRLKSIYSTSILSYNEFKVRIKKFVSISAS